MGKCTVTLPKLSTTVYLERQLDREKLKKNKIKIKKISTYRSDINLTIYLKIDRDHLHVNRV